MAIRYLQHPLVEAPLGQVANTSAPTKRDPDRELIRRVAMDIGKSAVSHLRVMYPDAYDAMPTSGHTSLRNHIHNEIMAALEVMDADEIERRLEQRKRDRRRAHQVFKRTK